ncbi:hypothetical protein CW304_29580 [Bacillus sp. UFRGS-B20]|nr:hypothetical protein CW304_29580 [Bacillus sp. UFRGS-B20]
MCVAVLLNPFFSNATMPFATCAKVSNYKALPHHRDLATSPCFHLRQFDHFRVQPQLVFISSEMHIYKAVLHRLLRSSQTIGSAEM